MLQRGLIGAVRLAPAADRIVLPHEDVMAGPVRGRRQLMEATRANLEPIFLLYQGGLAGNGPGGDGRRRRGRAAQRVRAARRPRGARRGDRSRARPRGPGHRC